MFFFCCNKFRLTYNVLQTNAFRLSNKIQTSQCRNTYQHYFRAKTDMKWFLKKNMENKVSGYRSFFEIIFKLKQKFPFGQNLSWEQFIFNKIIFGLNFYAWRHFPMFSVCESIFYWFINELESNQVIYIPPYRLYYFSICFSFPYPHNQLVSVCWNKKKILYTSSHVLSPTNYK